MTVTELNAKFREDRFVGVDYSDLRKPIYTSAQAKNSSKKVLKIYTSKQTLTVGTSTQGDNEDWRIS